MGLVVLLVGAAYACGSLPTGVWLARLAGVDVRRSGSGNIGATNVARTAGLRLGLLTLLGDLAKGLAPVLLARVLVTDARALACVGLAAFFGHIYSVFLRFSGGKGVATACGVFIGLAPLAVGVCVLVFAAIAFTTRYVSLASMAAAATLPVVTVVLHQPAPVSTAALIVAVLIVVRHRDNLSRLRAGTERKFGAREP